MGGDEIYRPVDETLEEARNRFWQNYLALGGRNVEWFDTHVEALLKVACPVPQPRPVYSPPRLDRSAHLPWGPEQFLEYYADESPELIPA